jgi:hypothetical protein
MLNCRTEYQGHAIFDHLALHHEHLIILNQTYHHAYRIPDGLMT